MSSAFEPEDIREVLRKLRPARESDHIELELSRTATAEALRDFNVSVRELREQLVKMGLDADLRGDKFRGVAPDAVLGLLLPAAHLLGAAIGFILRGWIDCRNGRKLKIRVGDVEVDATQMKEADIVRIFDLLQEKAERNRIRSMLTERNTKPESEER